MLGMFLDDMGSLLGFRRMTRKGHPVRRRNSIVVHDTAATKETYSKIGISTDVDTPDCYVIG